MKIYVYRLSIIFLTTFMLLITTSCSDNANTKSEEDSEDGIVKSTYNIAKKTYELGDALYKWKTGELVPENYRTRTMDKHEVVMEALSEKDSEKLKSVFCEELLEQDDLDEQIDNMFTYFDGGIVERGETTVMRTYYVKSNDIDELSVMLSCTEDVVTGNGKEYEKIIVFSDDANIENPELLGVTGIVLSINEDKRARVDIEIH